MNKNTTSSYPHAQLLALAIPVLCWASFRAIFTTPFPSHLYYPTPLPCYVHIYPSLRFPLLSISLHPFSLPPHAFSTTSCQSPSPYLSTLPLSSTHLFPLAPLSPYPSPSSTFPPPTTFALCDQFPLSRGRLLRAHFSPSIFITTTSLLCSFT